MYRAARISTTSRIHQLIFESPFGFSTMWKTIPLTGICVKCIIINHIQFRAELGGIYGPIPLARASSMLHVRMRRVHISGLLVRSGCSSGPDGICALLLIRSTASNCGPAPQVLKKLVSATCAIFGGSSISMKSIRKPVVAGGGKVGNAKGFPSLRSKRLFHGPKIQLPRIARPWCVHSRGTR